VIRKIRGVIRKRRKRYLKSYPTKVGNTKTREGNKKEMSKSYPTKVGNPKTRGVIRKTRRVISRERDV
jgi:hypothetical protein